MIAKEIELQQKNSNLLPETIFEIFQRSRQGLSVGSEYFVNDNSTLFQLIYYPRIVLVIGMAPPGANGR